MIETIRNAWKVEDLRKKMLFTLFIIVLFRFGATIPVPYIDTAQMKSYYAQMSGTFFGYLNLMSGGAFSQGTLFAMSISPYINASIIIQLLTVAIPALERLSKEGDEGRKKLNNYTRYLTVGIALLQGYGFYATLRSYGVIITPSALTALVFVVTLSAGTALLMWLADQINVYGIGNGISIILFAGIVSRAPATVSSMIGYVTQGYLDLELEVVKKLNPFVAIAIAVGAVLLVSLVVIVTNAERRVPVQYAKRVVGRKVYGGQSTHIPIKVNGTGVLPVIFAQSFLSIPSTIAFFFPASNPEGFWATFLKAFRFDHPIYALLYTLLIVGFSFFYISMTYNPVEIANNLKKNGGFVPGIRPGRPTSEYIARILNKITFFGSWFLVFIAILPIITTWFLPGGINISLGGTTIIILVGVALETVKQMESMMLMRHYKGFLE
ncbi:MAG: preprotein translocase subunit SecY [Clostridiales bacterium]|nr:preprotein translocase subunit SecY [Clostridiales bacterium]